MKVIDNPTLDEAANDDPTLGMVDYKDAPHTVLDIVDRQLEDFGLEVVMADTGDDTYQWRIKRREK